MQHNTRINKHGHGLISEAHHGHLARRLTLLLAPATHVTVGSGLPAVHY